MNFQILQLGLDKNSEEKLTKYVSIPITFQVTRIYDMDLTLENFSLDLIDVEPWTKDYDQLESPLQWSKKWDVSNWMMFVATRDNEWVGGAIVAWNTAGLRMLEDRVNLAVLWDIRVAPTYRGRSLGSQLVQAVEQWSRNQNCTELKVETQNINIRACQFYERMGYRLVTVNILAYHGLDEIQFIFQKSLTI